MRRTLAVTLLCLLTLVGAPAPARVAARAEAPAVVKVDPPNWWVGHSLGTIQLLVSGTNLAGSTLVSSSPAVSVERQTVNGRGTYLIAYVRIDAGAAPGAVALSLHSAGGDAPVPFDLLEKLAPEGRFQGLTPDDVIYLLMPDRFDNGDRSNDDPPGSQGNYDRKNPSAYHGGDFAGIGARLPYLKDLGVTALWLNPTYDNYDRGRDYHGYGAVDLYGTEEHFGTLGEFRQLVDAAHALGIKVVQDEVCNHTGQNHPWAQDPPTPTWYNGTPQNHLNNTYDIPSIVNQNASPTARRSTLEGWFGNFLPDLNQTDDETAQYLVQNTLWWIDSTGIDAIRQDTLPYVPRTFWARWMDAIHAEHAQFFVVGEVFNTAPFNTSFFQGGAVRWDGVDSKVTSVFDFPTWARIGETLGAGGDVRSLAATIEADDLYPNASVLVPFIGNHDTTRFITQYGGDARRLMLAQAFLLTTRGIPQLYYGDEIGLPGGGDPDNRRDFPGGFPGDKRDAFEASGRKKKQREIFDNVRRLLGARAQLEALRGPETVFPVASGSSLAYVRSNGPAHALVLVNAGPARADFDVNVSEWFAEGATVFDHISKNVVVSNLQVRNGRVRVTLDPLSAQVLAP